MVSRRIALALLFGIVCLPAPAALGATKFWKNSVTTGTWSTDNNWSNVSPAGADNGGKPALNDTVHIAPTTDANRTITYNFNSPALGALFVDLNTPPSVNRTTFNLPGNNLTVEGFIVGNNGNATVNHSAGTLTTTGVSSDSVLGNNSASDGVYNLSNTGAMSISRDLYVGSSGSGTFHQTGGTNTIASTLIVGSQAFVFGAYDISGGSLTTPNAFIGRFGQGFFTISNGATVTGNGATIGFESGSDGTATITGPGSQWTLTSSGLGVGANGSGALMISNGGTVSSRFGVIGIESGSEGIVSLSGQGSSWNVTESMIVGVSGTAELNIPIGTSVSAQSELTIVSGTVNLIGGTIRFGNYNRENTGTFNFEAGTIQLVGNRTFGSDETITELFGSDATITPSKNLTVEGTATIIYPVTVAGGTFSVGQLAGAAPILQQGTFNITNQALTIGAGSPIGAVLDLPAGVNFNVTLGTTNQGLVTGDGQIGGTFANAAAGELRAEPGRSLKLTGNGNTNSGQINLFGGQLEFTQNLTNNLGGFISGNGTLIARTGLANSGTMNFSGTANIVGDVTNAAGAKIISAGGGPTTFFDDVTNNGDIRTAPGSTTVFFGSYAGAGVLSGSGTTNFEGDLKPGNSPATVQFGGDVALGADAMLKIEIGGTTAGTGYDQLVIAGDLSLNGALDVSIINGFAPAAGQSFNILDWAGTRTGTFSSLHLPSIAGLSWNTSQLYTNGILSLTSAVGLPGDYNQNGTVDAADYTVWRDHMVSGAPLPNDDSPGVGPDDYSRWKSHFGEPGGGSAANSPTPEPSALLLSCLAFVLPFAARMRLL